MKLVYKATDNKEFLTKKDCVKYERSQRLSTELLKNTAMHQEYCPICDCYTVFSLADIKHGKIECSNCHKQILACSVCDACSTNCTYGILQWNSHCNTLIFLKTS